MTPLTTPARWLADARATATADAAAAAAHDPRRVDRDVTTVLLVAAVALTLGQFLSRDGRWIETLLRGVGADGTARWLEAALTTSSRAQLWQLLQWAAVQIVMYVAPSLLTIRLVLRAPARDFGLRIRGIGTSAWPYLALYAMALPFLVAVSFTGEFQARYPFYELGPQESLWPYLWIWWGLYALQFAALELFFRGFLVHGLVPRFGWLAVPIMVVPYTMLHFGKPMPEALAATVGGLVLGTLAVRTRSIWWGVALHVSIALTMDVLSLWQRGRL